VDIKEVKIMLRFDKRAQSTAEYAIVIALVIGAVVAMQVYVRRGLQARMKGAVDTYLIGQTSGNIMDGNTPVNGIPKPDGQDGLYEPEFTERKIDQERYSPTFESVSTDTDKEGEITRGVRDGEKETTNATGYEVYKP
jgi:hypothetical protein